MSETLGKIMGGLKAGEVIKDLGEEPAKQLARAGFIKETPIGDYVGGILAELGRDIAAVPLLLDFLSASPEPTALKNFFRTIMFKTAMVTAIVSEDAAEIISESASEAFSNAVYSGFAGAIDMLVRLNIGAQPPQDIEDWSVLNEITNAWVDAAAGYHYHYTALRWLDRQIGGLRDDLLADDRVRALLDSYAALKWPRLRIYARLSELYDSMIMRVAEAIAAALEHLFARVEDAANEYYAAKVLYENGQISEAEFNAVKAKIEAELDAAEAEVDAIVSALKDALWSMDWTPPETIDNIASALDQTLASTENNILDAWNAYLTELATQRSLGSPVGYYIINRKEGTSQVNMQGYAG